MAEGGLEEWEMGGDDIITGITKRDRTHRVPLDKSPVANVSPVYFNYSFGASFDEMRNNVRDEELPKIEHDESLYPVFNSEHMEVAEDAERAGAAPIENVNRTLARQEEVSSYLGLNFVPTPHPPRPPNPPPVAADLYMRNPRNNTQ